MRHGVIAGFERQHVRPVAAAAKVALEQKLDGSVEAVLTGEAAVSLQVLRDILLVALHSGLKDSTTV